MAKDVSKPAQARVSKKIGVLVKEGKSQKQAAGEAYGMERAGRLTKSGDYKRVAKK